MRISRRRPSLAAVHEREYVRSLDAGERGKAIGAGNRESGPGGIGAAAGGRRCDPVLVLASGAAVVARGLLDDALPVHDAMSLSSGPSADAPRVCGGHLRARRPGPL